MKLSRRDVTNLNHLGEYKNRIREIYSEAIHFKSTFEKIIEKLNQRIYHEVGYKNLPVIWKGTLLGINEQLFHELQTGPHFELRYQINGQWINSKELTHEQTLLINDDTFWGTFWRDTDKPFSVFKVGGQK